MYFEIVGPITDIEAIAISHSIRDVGRLNRTHGRGRWRKLKGIATVVLSDGRLYDAEMHWYEAHGIGRREIKLVRILR